MLMDPQLTIAGSNQAQGKVSAYFAPVLILFDCMQIETLQSWTLLELRFLDTQNTILSLKILQQSLTLLYDAKYFVVSVAWVKCVLGWSLVLGWRLSSHFGPNNFPIWQKWVDKCCRRNDQNSKRGKRFQKFFPFSPKAPFLFTKRDSF